MVLTCIFLGCTLLSIILCDVAVIMYFWFLTIPATNRLVFISSIYRRAADAMVMMCH